MEHDLDGILSALREAGTFDSNGEFTLDESRMREKMVRFQLPNPEMWVSTFVATAVQAGATQMEIVDSAGAWSLRWNGRHLGDALAKYRSSMLTAFASILQTPTSGGGYAGAMSRAMQALAVLRPTVVTVSSGVLRAEIRNGEVTTRSGPHDNQTRVEINPSEGWARLRSFLDGTSEYAGLAERRALERTCALAPLEIKFGADVISTKFDPGPVLAARYLEGAGPGFNVTLPRSTISQRRPDAAGVTALLWIPLEPTAQRVQSILVDGVEFASQEVLPLPGISYVAAIRGLSLDLSLTSFIRDETYAAAWAVLAEEAKVLYESNEGVGAPPGRRYQWLRDSLPYFRGAQLQSMMTRLLTAAMEVGTDVTLTHAAALLEELAPSHPDLGSVGKTLRKLLAARVRHGEDLVAPLVQCVRAEVRLGTPRDVYGWLAVLCALAGDPARARVVQDEIRPARDADAAERCAHETRYALFMRVGGSAKLAREMFEKNLAALENRGGELVLRNLQYLAETELALGEYGASREHFEAALRMLASSGDCGPSSGDRAAASSGDRAAGLSSSSGDRAAGLSSSSGDRAAGLSSSSGDRAAGSSSSSGGRAAGSSSSSGGRAAGLSSSSGDRAAGLSSSLGDRAAGLSSSSGDRAAGLSSSSGDRAAGLSSSSGDRVAGLETLLSAAEYAATKLQLLEGLAEAQERAGHLAEAAHTLEVAIDGGGRAEDVARCARRWTRLHGKGGGIVGFARSLFGLGRAHDDHYRAHAHPPSIPQLAQAETLMPDHAWSALTRCEEALAEVIDREGMGGDNYRTVLAMLARVHRDVDKGNMGDVHTAKIHLGSVFWKQFVAEHGECGKQGAS